MQVLTLFEGGWGVNGSFPDQLVWWFVSFVPQNDLCEWVTIAQILAINCPIWNITARKKNLLNILLFYAKVKCATASWHSACVIRACVLHFIFYRVNWCLKCDHLVYGIIYSTLINYFAILYWLILVLFWFFLKSCMVLRNLFLVMFNLSVHLRKWM